MLAEKPPRGRALMDRAAALVAALASRGGPRLPVLEWPESIDSTSDRLKELARAGAPEWTVVLADAADGGARPRGPRAGQSPPGGLYLSVLLRPRFGARRASLPLAAGVAVAEALSRARRARRAEVAERRARLGAASSPGILSEASSGQRGRRVGGAGDRRERVARRRAACPRSCADGVTSLHAHGARGRVRRRGGGGGARAARRLVRCPASRRRARVLAAWRERSVPWWGPLVEVRAGEACCAARLAGVDDEGALVLELAGGERRRLVSGEVSQLRPQRTLSLPCCSTIDVGNTNTVLGVFDGAELRAHWRLTTRREQTADEYGILVRNLFAGSGARSGAGRGGGARERGAAAHAGAGGSCAQLPGPRAAGDRARA